MQVTGIRYIAPLLDASGFAQAARDYIRAISSLKIPLTTRILSFERHTEFIDVGPGSNLAILHQDEPINYNVSIIHATPENFPKLYDEGKYNIGYTTWESSKMPKHRVDLCNNMQEIWVPSDYCVKVFKDSGVTVPVRKLVHVVPENLYTKPDSNLTLPLSSATYRFYSIFQWSARKAPEGLLRAYLSEFGPGDDVCLILKTYLNNGSPEEETKIKQFIERIRDDMGLEGRRPIYLITRLLSRTELQALHFASNCHISLHKSEGWGLSCSEAMAAGNYCIATDYSGNKEFMKEDHCGLVSWQEAPVYGMSFNPGWKEIYKGDQVWADPNLIDAAKKMRWAYENQNLARVKALAGQQYLKDNFSVQNIAERIKFLLETAGSNKE